MSKPKDSIPDQHIDVDEDDFNDSEDEEPEEVVT